MNKKKVRKKKIFKDEFYEAIFLKLFPLYLKENLHRDE